MQPWSIQDVEILPPDVYLTVLKVYGAQRNVEVVCPIEEWLGKVILSRTYPTTCI
jgi:hypothetical protein